MAQLDLRSGAARAAVMLTLITTARPNEGVHVGIEVKLLPHRADGLPFVIAAPETSTDMTMSTFLASPHRRRRSCPRISTHREPRLSHVANDVVKHAS